ncbi:MAG: endonuclease III domain-containing protein [Deltaproteobacteria bacterium]|nr:endonuclease III domain-containing protein [Candidatus Tharpellaceae bacterium]
MFKALLAAYGPQSWWPAESIEETIIGAILTQNTSWKNVERALAVLRQGELMDFSKLAEIKLEHLAESIRSSGYYNQKAKRLQNFCRRLKDEHGNLSQLATLSTRALRDWLLDIHGIGKETADSILLYAFSRPVFVVDAYTIRIFSRHHLIKETSGYDQVQTYIHENLKPEAQTYNEFHALLVRTGKECCRRKHPRCENCPLTGDKARYNVQG